MADLANTDRKHLSALQQKKYREEYRECLVDGFRLCDEALHSAWNIKRLFVTQEFLTKPDSAGLLERAGIQGITPESIPADTLERITTTQHSQGIAVLLEIPQQSDKLLLSESMEHFVLMDGVSDPGNVGTLLRSADWFGITKIICGPGTVEWTNPKVMRASMGAVFHLDIISADSWEPVIASLVESGVTLLAADLSGENIAVSDFAWNQTSWGLILGNEAHGVSPALASRANRRVTIPGKGAAESLNVAMAGTILLYELCR